MCPCVPAYAPRLLNPLAGLFHRWLRAGGGRSEQSSAPATLSSRGRQWPAMRAASRWVSITFHRLRVARTFSEAGDVERSALLLAPDTRVETVALADGSVGRDASLCRVSCSRSCVPSMCISMSSQAHSTILSLKKKVSASLPPKSCRQSGTVWTRPDALVID